MSTIIHYAHLTLFACSARAPCVHLSPKMNNDPGIICIRHCNSDIFSFSQAPSICPICKDEFSVSSLPFRLPYPFVRASQHPCSIILKPTIGDFLRDYTTASDLHIGLTNSNGVVYSFDERGVTTGPQNDWSQCLTVPGLSALQCFRETEWDECLLELASCETWTASRYKERDCNCYSFVLEFLKKINVGELSEAAVDKEEFCQRNLIPITSSAAKYITVFRKLTKGESLFVQRHS